MYRYVKNIYRFITEALNRSEWMNYQNDTTLNSPDHSGDVDEVSQMVMKLLNTDNPGDIMFTGDDVSIGDDYRYFCESIVPKSKKVQEGTLNRQDYTAYYSVYENGGKFFVKLDIKEMAEYSYIFMRSDDYEYFDKLDAPIVPQPVEEAPAQETPAQAAPAQPEGAGAGNLL